MMAEKAAIETWSEKTRLTKWLGVEMENFESRYLFYLLLKY